MSRRRLTALLLALVLLAAPAAAFADGAGDQQYQDPLTAPVAPQKKKPKKTAAAPTASAPATSTSGVSGSSQPAASGGSAGSGSASSELPRTGAPTGQVALAGALLIACGLALRRRTSAT